MFILFKEGSRELYLREDVFFFMALEVGNIVEGTVTGMRSLAYLLNCQTRV